MPVDTANLPGYAGRLAHGVSNASPTTFVEFSNDICPEYCYDPDRQCPAANYQVLCREGSALTVACDPSPNPELGDPTLVDITSTSVQSTSAPAYETLITASTADVFFRDYFCAVEGTLNGNSLQTCEFAVNFEYCSEPAVCEKVVHE